jgi:hypothetical protein
MWWIIGIAILVWLLYRGGKENKGEQTQMLTASEEPSTERGAAMEEDEEVRQAKRIRKLAQQKENEAKQKGLDDLVVKVFDETQHFPSWIKKDSDYVPKVVSEATYLDEKKTFHGGYILTINQNKYKITTTESSGYELSDRYLDIEVFENEEKKFEVNCTIDSDQWTTSYSPFSVKAYKDGSWIADFQLLISEIDKLEKERKRKELVNANEIEKLKNNFDIE